MRYDSMRLYHFNSIKVRLEQHDHCQESCVLPDFNSIKVRLERGLHDVRQQPQSNFNSIKVRLELGAVEGDYVTFVFQFHKGTIRTVGIDTDLQDINISIP